MPQQSVKRACRLWTMARLETTPHASDPTLSERKDAKDEIQLLTEANLPPRHLARFSYASRRRISGAPLSWDVAEKPFADLDAVWGKGITNSDQFVQVVYLTL
jgi:hypothetical protein